CLASTASGGAGAPPEATMSLCREPADAMRRLKAHGGKARPRAARRTPRRSAGRRPRCALKLAQFAPSKSKTARLTERTGAPPGAPSLVRLQAHPAPQATGVMTHALVLAVPAKAGTHNHHAAYGPPPLWKRQPMEESMQTRMRTIVPPIPLTEALYRDGTH